jgi:CRISPR/Cas system Type II protein with McrA/HNH and RuvC-like nuclease domain
MFAPPLAFGFKGGEALAGIRRVERAAKRRLGRRELKAASVTLVAVEVMQRQRVNDGSQRDIRSLHQFGADRG